MFSSQMDKAYSMLKRKILNQEIRQGESVIERELAASLNISRTPIREAIRRLESDGLLEIIPRRGAFVKTFTNSDLIGLYEMAEGLEVMVAYLVTENTKTGQVKQTDIDNLKAQILNMSIFQTEEDYTNWVEADEKFHRVLYDLCNNRFIKESIVKIRTQLNVTPFNALPALFDFNTSNSEHEALLNSIEKGDSEEARRIIQLQHHRIRNYLMKYYRVPIQKT